MPLLSPFLLYLNNTSTHKSFLGGLETRMALHHQHLHEKHLACMLLENVNINDISVSAAFCVCLLSVFTHNNFHLKL